MGFRFRRTIPLFPGVHLNLSKSGASLSLGYRGAMINVGRSHNSVSVGAPGTGLGYRASVGRGLILVLLLLAAVAAAGLYFFPDLIRPLLHRWQPHWF